MANCEEVCAVFLFPKMASRDVVSGNKLPNSRHSVTLIGSVNGRDGCVCAHGYDLTGKMTGAWTKYQIVPVLSH